MTIIDQDEEYWDAQREYDLKQKEATKKWQKNHKKQLNEYARKVHLKKRFGITPEQYDELFIKQKSCCSICGKHQTEFKNRLSIDHDHITGKIRGLLCYHCNSMLGYSHDNPEILQKAILYLEQYS